MIHYQRKRKQSLQAKKKKKALQGLKKAPRAKYSEIHGYFLEKGFQDTRVSQPCM